MAMIVDEACERLDREGRAAAWPPAQERGGEPGRGRVPAVLRAARVFWIGLAAVLVIKAIAAPTKHSVYPEYWKASRAWFAGDPLGALMTKQYLPFFTDLIAPIAALPLRWSGAVWAIASIGAVAAALRAMLDEVFPADLSARERAWIWLVTPWVGLQGYANGQANPMILAGLMAATVAARRGRWGVAAALLAAASFKIYPIAFALVLAGLYPRRLGPRLVLAMAGVMAVPLLLHPAWGSMARLEAILDYAGSGVHREAFGDTLIGLREFAERCGVPMSAPGYFAMQAGAGAALWLALLGRRRSGADARSVLLGAFVLTSLWFAVFAPSVEPPTLVLCGPALAWSAVEARRRGDRIGLAVSAAALALAGPVQLSMFGPIGDRLSLDGALVAPALLAVWAAGVWREAAAAGGRLPAARTAREAVARRPGLGELIWISLAGRPDS